MEITFQNNKKLKRLSSEVYGAIEDIVSIDLSYINKLKNEVLTCQNKRIRICAHQSSDDKLHEMLIVMCKGSYVRPHKHINKSESFHIIEGMLDVVLFNDEGDILDIIQMGDVSSGKNFFYRLSAFCFHTLILKSDFVVFHETTNGPFIKESTLFAPWSPEVGDQLIENKFMQELEFKIASSLVEL